MSRQQSDGNKPCLGRGDIGMIRCLSLVSIIVLWAIGCSGKNEKTSSLALIRASYNCDDEKVRRLLEGGADAQSTDKKKRSVLMYACATFTSAMDDNCRENIVKRLIDGGALVNHRSSDGLSALNIAARVGNYRLVRRLVDNGADIHYRSQSGRTLYHDALGFEVRELQKEYYDVVYDGGRLASRGQQLSSFYSGDRPKMVKYLIGKGLRLDVADEEGITPLILVVKAMVLRHNRIYYEQYVPVVEVMMERGVDVNAVDKSGKSALAYAYEYANGIDPRMSAIVSMLKMNGAKE